MNKLTEYYSREFRKKEQHTAADEKHAEQVEQNKKTRLTTIINQAISAMLKAAEISYPQCEKLLWRNHEQAGFFSTKYEDKYYFGWSMDHPAPSHCNGDEVVYLLIDGTLVIFMQPYEGEYGPDGGYIMIEVYFDKWSSKDMMELCCKVLTKASAFGVPTSDLQRWKGMLDAI